jgi:hypothetical protein
MTVFLNVYKIWTCYGGPEEGGWDYEAGEPLESTLISNLSFDEYYDQVSEEERIDLRSQAKHKWVGDAEPTPKKTGYGGYTFMPGSNDPNAFLTYENNNDIRVCFEEEFAQPYPQERPTYC